MLKEIFEYYHLINRLEKFLLINKNSGAVYKIDPKLGEILASNLNNNYSNLFLPQEMELELRELLGEKSNLEILKESAKKLEKRTAHPKAFCLNVAHSCNLSCLYCFAEKGYREEDNQKLMSEKTARRAIDFLFAAPYPVIELDFFGGEPLLNWKAVKNSIIYAGEKTRFSGKKIKLALTTNGILLTQDICRFLNQYEVNLTLSLDGPKEVHNDLRILNNGKGSFDSSFYKIKQAVFSRNYQNYYIRGTYTKKTLNFSKAANFFIEENLENFSLEPVISKDTPWSLDFEDLPIIEQEYEILANLLVKRKKEGKPFSFYHFNLNLYNSPCIEKRLQSCGVGVEYLAITPQGEIYPCHQLTGYKEFKLGDIFQGIDIEKQEIFKKIHFLNSKDCLTCWAKIYCAGGCIANNYYFSSSLFKPPELFCALLKIRLEYALALSVE
ncbi:MAG: SPASM domain-containing protein [Armatimonadetes bacterium]|nr:SPASM domain-containing protein [Armatimonadota bacterium]